MNWQFVMFPRGNPGEAFIKNPRVLTSTSLEPSASIIIAFDQSPISISSHYRTVLMYICHGPQ